jgi:hypothetical protein
MESSIEWVIPGENPLLVCLMPEHHGMSIREFLESWSLPQTSKIYSWQEPLEHASILQPGMRLHIVSPLIIDPKENRRLVSSKTKRHTL